MADRNIYTIKELKALGYPISKVRQLCKSQVANIITMPRTSDKGTFYIKKDKLDEYWGWLDD